MQSEQDQEQLEADYIFKRCYYKEENVLNIGITKSN